MKNYFLCSKSVIDFAKPNNISKPFKSGYDFENDYEYYIATLNFNQVKNHYDKVIAVNKDSEDDFWCKECIEGNFSVDKFTIKDLKKNGIFVEIERKLNFTNDNNRAMVINNLARKFNCTPIELINKIG